MMSNTIFFNNVDFSSIKLDAQAGTISFSSRNTDSTPSGAYQERDKDKLQGGGNKPASNGQMNFLSNLCEERGVNLDSTCMNKFHKKPRNLLGCEADSLIKEIRQR